MDENTKFDYYYGIEADQFSFYRVPRLLIKDERFKGLSSDAKLLYGLMLDRMSLSMKNGWLDKENRAYIIYTVDAIMEDLGCAKATCVKIMKELDSEKGIGLIEKKRRGLGKPDIIYVKNFATMSAEQEVKEPKNTGKSTEAQNLNFKKSNIDTSRSSEIELQEVQNLNHQKYKKQTSRGSETELAEVQDLAPIYTNYNKTDMSYTNPIYPSGEGKQTDDMMDGADAYIEIIKENIEYDHHMKYDEINDRELYDELFELICEVVCVKRTMIRIAGEEYPYELVKSKFLKLRSSHLEYVMGCMKDTTTKISNIKAYMVTALYNAPSTINHYYQQEVQHDMYGEAGMKRVLFKIIVPVLILVLWILMCYPVCQQENGFDYFFFWIMVGFPYGIRKMCMFLIPKKFGIAGSIGVLAFNGVIGGLMGGIIVIARMIAVFVEIIKIIAGTSGHDVQKCDRRDIM